MPLKSKGSSLIKWRMYSFGGILFFVINVALASDVHIIENVVFHDALRNVSSFIKKFVFFCFPPPEQSCFLRGLYLGSSGSLCLNKIPWQQRFELDCCRGPFRLSDGKILLLIITALGTDVWTPQTAWHGTCPTSFVITSFWITALRDWVSAWVPGVPLWANLKHPCSRPPLRQKTPILYLAAIVPMVKG